MKRLQREILNLPKSGGLPRVPHKLRAIVAGGGIAGVAAATILSERGVDVTLIEKQAVLGGRAGGFPHSLANGEQVEMERGFHAFFRQYYNLRSLLMRIDPSLAFLEPLDDYPILGPEGRVQSFRGLPKQTPWQVIALTWKTPHLRAADLVRTNARAALEMLRFDAPRTYERFDAMTAADYLDSLAFPPMARRMLFDVFSHSFFNPESEMSAAELLMMFHFYFTGNQEGLLFDVARRPLSKAVWEPFATWLSEHGVNLRTGCAVHKVERAGTTGWLVEHDGGHSEADLLVLALDVEALRHIVAASPQLKSLQAQTDSLSVTRPFAVWRLWLDRPVLAQRPAFAGVTGIGMLDNISVYNHFQDESRAWAQTHGGAVVELHAYAVAADAEEGSIRGDLLAGLHQLYPETRDARILDEYFLLRRDCPAFAPGQHSLRPTVATAFADLALAGDFVSVPVPCALMERAAVSGMLAANTLLAAFGVAAEPIHSIPRRGLLARRRAADADAPARRSEWIPRRRADPASTTRSLYIVGRELPDAALLDERPDWVQASPAWITRALASAQALPSGGWYVLHASAAIDWQPRCLWVCNRALVVWRDAAGVHAAPDACPHLGASLSTGRVCEGRLVCPWHGLALGPGAHGAWQPLPTHDDGILSWVRIDGEEPATITPQLAPRPPAAIDATVRLEAECDPQDVIANRLDPWHGTHLHTSSFAALRVIDQQKDEITVRVAFRLAGPIAVEVDARFHCVDRRTIVMSIVRGEGEGSIVETHVTPTRPGKTAIVETTLTTSERPGFQRARPAATLLRPALRWAARRLWVDDVAYAERLYALRSGTPATR